MIDRKWGQMILNGEKSIEVRHFKNQQHCGKRVGLCFIHQQHQVLPEVMDRGAGTAPSPGRHGALWGEGVGMGVCRSGVGGHAIPDSPQGGCADLSEALSVLYRCNLRTYVTPTGPLHVLECTLVERLVHILLHACRRQKTYYICET